MYPKHFNPKNGKIKMNPRRVKSLILSLAFCCLAFFLTGISANDADAKWIKIGGPAGRVFTGGKGLYATSPDKGKIYRYEGIPGKWTKVGEQGSAFAVNDTALYGLNPKSDSVWQYTGTGLKWIKIGGPAGQLYAGGKNFYATNPKSGDIYHYQGIPGKWAKVGGPGRTFAVNDMALYGLSIGSDSVWQYTGTGQKWINIGGPTDLNHIYAGGKNLYATNYARVKNFYYINPPIGDIYHYQGIPGKWAKVGGPGHTFAVNDVALYGLSQYRNTVWQYTGVGQKWVYIGGVPPGETRICFIWAEGTNLYAATGPRGGAGTWGYNAIWQYQPEKAAPQIQTPANDVISKRSLVTPLRPSSVKESAVYQNYPNPFNPETWIPFQLAQDTPVSIRIHNATGQLIRTLALGDKNAGVYMTKDKAAYWDGKDSKGSKVASGLYYYTLQAGDLKATRKMTIMK